MHKNHGDDAENRRKKPKKKMSSTSDRVLNSRNDATTKRESSSSQTVKRKSEQMTRSNVSVGQEEDLGSPKPKKPSPKHSVSIHFKTAMAMVSAHA